jgi:hypothetical protein
VTVPPDALDIALAALLGDRDHLIIQIERHADRDQRIPVAICRELVYLQAAIDTVDRLLEEAAGG